MNLLFVMLEEAPKAGGMQGLIMMFAIIVVFYLFMIRPQVKKQKDLQKFRKSIEKGDKVVTTGGIYGKVVEIADAYLMVEAGPNVKLKIDKNAVLKEPADLAAKK